MSNNKVRILGKYEYDPKTDRLGGGGFGDVYKAKDIYLDKIRAIKIYKGEQSEYDVIQEIKKMIDYSHPNLIRFYDAGLISYADQLHGTSTAQVGVMEFVNSGTLAPFWRKCKDPAIRGKLIRDILQGLNFMQQNNIIHRDLKPANILIQERPKGTYTAKLADFGLSKDVDSLKSQSVILGTCEYMAPEQLMKEKYGIGGRMQPNLDLWAFGVILYELFTGKVPFGSRANHATPMDIRNNIDKFKEGSLDTSMIPEPYSTIIQKCLIKHAGNRTNDCGELLRLLDQHSSSEIKAAMLNTVNMDDGNDELMTMPADSGESDRSTNQIQAPYVPVSSGNDFAPSERPFEEEKRHTQNVDPGAAYHTDSNLNQKYHREQAKSGGEKKESGASKWALLLGIPLLLLLAGGAFWWFTNNSGTDEETSKSKKEVNKAVGELSDKKVKDLVAGEMVLVKGGTFEMGCITGDKNCGADEKPAHKVTVNDFYLDAHEVTVEQFKAFVDATNYKTDAEKRGTSKVFGKGDWKNKEGIYWKHNAEGKLHYPNDYNHPVIHVSWNDATAFAKWAGKRLPTEAEWEYAAKAGGQNNKWGVTNEEKDLDLYANYQEKGKDEDGYEKTAPVGKYKPNQLGLYDMVGNVWEWCSDAYDPDYYKESAGLVNPKGPLKATGDRVCRGGSWYDLPKRCRASIRLFDKPDDTSYYLGFRCAKTP